MDVEIHVLGQLHDATAYVYILYIFLRRSYRHTESCSLCGRSNFNLQQFRLVRSRGRLLQAIR